MTNETNIINALRFSNRAVREQAEQANHIDWSTVTPSGGNADRPILTKADVARAIAQGTDGNFDREAMRETMMKAREERDKKYEEVLTKEQLVKFREIQEQRRSEMRQQYQESSPDNQAEKPARGRSRN